MATRGYPAAASSDGSTTAPNLLPPGSSWLPSRFRRAAFSLPPGVPRSEPQLAATNNILPRQGRTHALACQSCSRRAAFSLPPGCLLASAGRAPVGAHNWQLPSTSCRGKAGPMHSLAKAAPARPPGCLLAPPGCLLASAGLAPVGAHNWQLPTTSCRGKAGPMHSLVKAAPAGLPSWLPSRFRRAAFSLPPGLPRSERTTGSYQQHPAEARPDPCTRLRNLLPPGCPPCRLPSRFRRACPGRSAQLAATNNILPRQGRTHALACRSCSRPAASLLAAFSLPPGCLLASAGLAPVGAHNWQLPCLRALPPAAGFSCRGKAGPMHSLAKSASAGLPSRFRRAAFSLPPGLPRSERTTGSYQPTRTPIYSS